MIGLGNRGRPRHADVQFIPWVQKDLKRKAIWFLLADEWCEWMGPGLFNAELVLKTYYHEKVLKERPTQVHPREVHAWGPLRPIP